MANERISKLLAKYRKAANFTQAGAAEFLGVPRSTVNSWEHSLSEPDITAFLNLCALYGIKDIQKAFSSSAAQNGVDTIPGYSSLNNEGIRRVKDYIADMSMIKKYTVPKSQTKRYVYTIPLFDMAASAGTGQFLEGSEASYLSLPKLPPDDADFIIRVSGDSMEPDYHNGDRVFIKKTQSIEHGETGIFSINGSAFIKTLGDGELISRNSAYAPIPLHDYDSIECFGKVVGIMGKEYE